MLQFTKIKYDLKAVYLVWTTANGGEEHKHEYTNRDTPHPDFTDALARLKTDVLELLELDGCGYEADMRVQSVSFSVSDSGVAGAVITSLKAVKAASGPFVMNTPYLPEDGDEKQKSMPRSLVTKLHRLRREAESYIDGSKRNEASLFSSSPAEDRANAEAGAGEPVPV